MEFTLKTTLNAPAKDIFNTWISSEGHTKMTGGEAIASNKVGGSFTAWDGYIQGKNLVLEENKRIVQSWRTSQFEPHEEDSQIEVVLTEKGGNTELTLIHSKVPESGEHYIKGWDEHYFQPMKKYFTKN
ncbi:SRPBCC domain-containing protein [Sediminicola luteus]|uniref:SRPBCC domain-containing protein n=1 Tax=Sediminicola luteus TaxID=319238 RepID=A0ABV2TV87_9FLAO